MKKKMPNPNKDERIHLRIQESIKNDALAVANLRGLQLSSLIHNLLVEAINKEKADRPALLADEVKKVREQGIRVKMKVPVTRAANVTERVQKDPLTRSRRKARKR
jgi:hypothetical protein